MGVVLATAPFFSLGSYRPGREKRTFHQWERTLGLSSSGASCHSGDALPLHDLNLCTASTHRHLHCLAAPLCTPGYALTQPGVHAHIHLDTYTQLDTHIHQTPSPGASPPPLAGIRCTHDPLCTPQPWSFTTTPQRSGVIKVPFECAYNFYLKIPFQDNFQACQQEGWGVKKKSYS